jgi:hypothetical protein
VNKTTNHHHEKLPLDTRGRLENLASLVASEDKSLLSMMPLANHRTKEDRYT